VHVSEIHDSMEFYTSIGMQAFDFHDFLEFQTCKGGASVFHDFMELHTPKGCMH
jgi:hypothetical protein